MVKKARILSLGSYLPETVLSNADLEKMVETTDEWIMTRTGIRERRIASSEESSSDMGAKAAEAALAKAGLTANDIDYIIVATMTPDYLMPATAALIQAKLGRADIPSMDIQAACSGFLYGLSIAQAYIAAGMYRRILLVAAEKMSSFVDYTDRKTCVLFGDGASAAIIAGSGSGLMIENSILGADGTLSELIIVPAGGSKKPPSNATLAAGDHYLKVSGQEVFKHAVRRMAAAADECLAQAGLKKEEIQWLVPHQANGRIIDAIAKQMAIPEERVYKTLEKYGNTSASGIGIALDELWQQENLQLNDKLLLVAFGGGLTWGASLLTKVAD